MARNHDLVPGFTIARKISRRAFVPLMVMQTLDSSSVGMRWCHISAIFCLRGGVPRWWCTCSSLPHRTCERLDCEFRGLEVRLAQTELHGVVPGHVEHPPHSGWTNVLRAVGESHHDLRTSVLGF